MIHMPLVEAAAIVSGVLDGNDTHITGVSTDSRTLAEGELFVALRGPSFDGHEFIAAARSRGAAAALVEQPRPELPCVVVSDARSALGTLAAQWRTRFTPDTVGVTGSNGKTTVKEMLACILAGDAPVLATRGNLNNDIGLPLTLARLDARYRRLVVEMGANHPGEIARLASMARPRVGVITLIASAHLEGFGSIEGVARAKGELLLALPEDGVAVVNADQDYMELWRELAVGRTLLCFGFADGADVRVTHEPTADGGRVGLFTAAGEAHAKLALFGRHNALNAGAACAAALAMGVGLDAVVAGLEAVRPLRGRLETLRAGRVRVLDDTYNANPQSLRAALEVLAAAPSPRWLVLGDMGELGGDAAAFHAQAGRMARELGTERLFTLGPLASLATETFGAGASHFPERDALCRALEDEITDGTTVLVKGSRAMAMESVVRELLKGELQCC